MRSAQYKAPKTDSGSDIDSKPSDVSYGKDGAQKILVTYASGFGSTREVAQQIAETLSQHGAYVDVQWIYKVQNLNDYAAVIIGSAIQYDRWMPEARNFVTTHSQQLSQLPVAYFFTCMTLSIQNERTERQAMTYANKIAALHPQVKPLSVGRFAGALDYNKLPLVFTLIAKLVFRFLGVKKVDFRDWNAIQTWAKQVNTKFNLNAQTTASHAVSSLQTSITHQKESQT